MPAMTVSMSGNAVEPEFRCLEDAGAVQCGATG